VVIFLFPYSLREVSFNWYANLPPRCVKDWDTFQKLFLEQFKTFINLVVIHHQFISIKRDLVEIVSRFNHHFHMAYCKLEMPYTIPVEATIQIYLNYMDHLMAIFLRRLPTTNIDTLEKFFLGAITFTKQANPNGGGLMPLAQAITTIPTYPFVALMMPSQFIPMNLTPLQ
jgi:hypothetical protein